MAEEKGGIFATAPPLESAAGLEVTELKAEEIQEAFNRAASTHHNDNPAEHGPPGGAGIDLEPEPIAPPKSAGAKGGASNEGPCIETKGFSDPPGTGITDLKQGPLPGSGEEEEKGLAGLGEKVLGGCGGVIDGIKEKIGDSIFVPADPTEPLPGVEM